MGSRRPVGVLLINLGSPTSPRPGAVRRYLREFLGDPRVLELPAPLRWFFLHAVILPSRSQTTAAAYAKIWSAEGSPLLVHSRALCDALTKTLGDPYAVALAMRYGEPSLTDALGQLARADVERVLAIPLFPQYASASTGSACEALFRAASRGPKVPPLEVMGAFYDDPRFTASLATVTGEALGNFRHDHVLFSFHGLPERQIKRSDASGRHCLSSKSCCADIRPANRFCYRAQCYATARAVATALSLANDHWSVSFQSRLGRTPWLQPYTDHVLPELRHKGVRRLAVVCPSFVADCLETLEEIGIRAREQWHTLGGEELRLAPCLNAHPAWIGALARMIRTHGQPAHP